MRKTVKKVLYMLTAAVILTLSIVTVTVPSRAAGDDPRKIYFDATLSKVNYSDGDKWSGGAQVTDNQIPRTDDVVYYHAWVSTDTSDVVDGEMTKESAYTDGVHTWEDVWSVELPAKYDMIIFKNDSAWNGNQTTDLAIPTEADKNCFYADTGDQAVYNEHYAGGSSSYNVHRNGHWGGLYEIGTEGDKVSYSASGTEDQRSDRRYVTTSFYDYYSDMELNGVDRSSLGVSNSASGPQLGYNNRTYMTHRIFNMALSDYYAANAVPDPIYFGHFQWKDEGGGRFFKTIADDLNLYGYNENKDLFYHNNNSEYRLSDGNCETTYPWTSHDTDVATQGLVGADLAEDSGLLLNGGADAPFFDEAFLEGNNSYHTSLGRVYEDVTFPFKKVGDYWCFDSKQDSLRMTYDSAKDNYFLNEVSDAVKGYANNSETANGNFFPFDDAESSGNPNELNYAFGMKMDIDFRLTEDGTIYDSAGNQQPITFNFSGDDDIWIYIDGKLALDLGGGHGIVTGALDFQDMTATVSKVKTADGEVGNQTSFSLVGDNGDQHHLTLYYMERGMWESDMMITFNFPEENLFSLEKEVDTSEVDSLFTDDAQIQSNLKNLLFDYQIENLATHYAAKSVADMDAIAAMGGFIMKQDDIADYGSVTSGKLEPVNGAKYSILSIDENGGETLVGDKEANTVAEGTVSIKDHQIAQFSNKFRRGSYLYVKEKTSPMMEALSGTTGDNALTNVFDTTWSIYNGEEEISDSQLQSSSQWVTGSTADSVSNQSGLTAADGRTEVLTDGQTDFNGTIITNTAITSMPSQAILFRDYSVPDSETQVVDLRVKYVNHMKTGAIAVSKEQAQSSALALDENQEYRFEIRFNNVAGLKLEDTLDGSYQVTKDNKLVETFTLKKGETRVFTGIPAGTEYEVVELSPSDGSVLTTVSNSLADSNAPEGVSKDAVVVSPSVGVRGTVAADENRSEVQTFTFYNSKEEQKAPEDTDGNTPGGDTDNTPDDGNDTGNNDGNGTGSNDGDQSDTTGGVTGGTSGGESASESHISNIPKTGNSSEMLLEAALLISFGIMAGLWAYRKRVINK